MTRDILISRCKRYSLSLSQIIIRKGEILRRCKFQFSLVLPECDKFPDIWTPRQSNCWYRDSVEVNLSTIPFFAMRPLDEPETQQVFEKLHKYIGKNLQQLVERQGPPGPDGTTSGFCLRLHKQRVFYVSEVLILLAPTCANSEVCTYIRCDPRSFSRSSRKKKKKRVPYMYRAQFMGNRG